MKISITTRLVPLMHILLASATGLFAEEADENEIVSARSNMETATTENSISFSPSYTLGLTPSACLSLGRLTAVTIGGTFRFTWRPIRELSFDAAASARWLIGHDFSLAVSCLWSPLRSGA